jgi:hypothetical protein
VRTRQDARSSENGFGCTPSFSIGQRALLVKSNAGNVLWDCMSYLDDEIAERIGAEGGLAAAVSEALNAA